MPNNQSAKKRLRQSDKRRVRNRATRSEIRTRTRSLLDMQSKSEAETALRELSSTLDRAAQRGIIPSNAASRQKARIAQYVAGLD